MTTARQLNVLAQRRTMGFLGADAAYTAIWQSSPACAGIIYDEAFRLRGTDNATLCFAAVAEECEAIASDRSRWKILVEACPDKNTRKLAMPYLQRMERPGPQL